MGRPTRHARGGLRAHRRPLSRRPETQCAPAPPAVRGRSGRDPTPPGPRAGTTRGASPRLNTAISATITGPDPLSSRPRSGRSAARAARAVTAANQLALTPISTSRPVQPPVEPGGEAVEARRVPGAQCVRAASGRTGRRSRRPAKSNGDRVGIRDRQAGCPRGQRAARCWRYRPTSRASASSVRRLTRHWSRPRPRKSGRARRPPKPPLGPGARPIAGPSRRPPARAKKPKPSARARALAEERAKQETERRREAERRAREDAERLISEAAERAREEAAAQAREEAAAERKAREQAERQAREVAERRVEAERKAREEAERQAAAERRAREQAERRRKEEEERRAREDAERKAKEEAERKAREEEARKRKEEDERRATAKTPSARRRKKRTGKAREEAERQGEGRRRSQGEGRRRAQGAGRGRSAEAQAGRGAAPPRGGPTGRRPKQISKCATSRKRARRPTPSGATRRKPRARRAKSRNAGPKPSARREKTGREGRRGRAVADPAGQEGRSQFARARRRRQRAKAREEGHRGPRSVQDEWGFYDPHAAGFEALFGELEAIENGGTEPWISRFASERRAHLAMWAFEFERYRRFRRPSLSRRGPGRLPRAGQSVLHSPCRRGRELRHWRPHPQRQGLAAGQTARHGGRRRPRGDSFPQAAQGRTKQAATERLTGRREESPKFSSCVESRYGTDWLQAHKLAALTPPLTQPLSYPGVHRVSRRSPVRPRIVAS